MAHALIVDDDVDAASSLKLLIAEEHLTVAVAHTLHEARRQIALQQPDLILLDLQLPDGSGMALFGPSWQASVSEQVPAEALPSAVALNGISYNIARSFGPAIGGIIVAVAGSVAAFAVNALLYIPLLVVLFFWKRVQEPSRLPPERLGRAVISGARYVSNSPAIRIVLGRTLATGIAGGSISASSGDSAWDCHATVDLGFTDADGNFYGVVLTLRDPVFSRSTWSCVGPPELACDVEADDKGQPLAMTVTIRA